VPKKNIPIIEINLTLEGEIIMLKLLFLTVLIIFIVSCDSDKKSVDAKAADSSVADVVNSDVTVAADAMVHNEAKIEAAVKDSAKAN